MSHVRNITCNMQDLSYNHSACNRFYKSSGSLLFSFNSFSFFFTLCTNKEKNNKLHCRSGIVIRSYKFFNSNYLVDAKHLNSASIFLIPLDINNSYIESLHIKQICPGSYFKSTSTNRR